MQPNSGARLATHSDEDGRTLYSITGCALETDG